ncbi:MAG: TolC family protein [Cyanobacteriota bacterium]|nr:TolC family protein [Cyanobacteriota bacterium]MDY6357938.1 TolC family protein [Cyanobacteriota bacterium]MDY6363734.1 TolC family protein [Cyanobacteriota bacterium]MDY6382434.1 TolC family protein [Cyanobacteriota bacterium]
MKKLLFILLSFTLIILPANADNTGYLNLPFWNKFNDETLINNLMNVYQNNHDLKAAVIKVNEANRVVKMAFANELPHIGFDGYVGEIFNSSDEVFGDIRIPDYTEMHYLLPLTMNYEIDIWGENRLKTKSKQKQFEAVKEDERAAYIYITSAFAADYFNLIRTDKLIQYQKQQIDLQNQIIKAYETRYKLGTATLSDIENAQKNLTYAKEELQKLLEHQDTLKNQMSVLLSDKSFGDIQRTDFDKLNILITIPDSIKFEVLDNRPDRVKSELDLERIGIDVKVARRDLLPKFIISGNIGFNMYSISSPHNFLADLGIVPTWDLFMGGRKIQMLKLQKDKYDVAIEHYEKTILTSIQESNDALYSLKTAGKINSITNDRLKTDERELLRTEIRQDAGTADNLDLLLHKQRLLTSKMQTVSAKTNEIISGINLYQALGGADFTSAENL